MDHVDTREWLLTNGLGSFASGTVCDARTRTYHGWLIAALNPPGCRSLLLSHLEASLEISRTVFALGTNVWAEKVDPLGYRLLRTFQVEPVPQWVWGQEGHWELSRQIVMPHVLSETGDSSPDAEDHDPFTDVVSCSASLLSRVLVHYTYQGKEPAILRLRPLIGDRTFHQLQQQNDEHTFSQLVAPHQLLLQSLREGKTGIPWQLRWTQGTYQLNPVWYWNYYYSEEAARGLDCQEDLYSPGYLTVLLQPGDTVTLDASVGLPTAALPELTASSFDRAVAAEVQRLNRTLENTPVPPHSLQQRLLKASDQFITYHIAPRDPRIIAGYHWFGDRSRETLLCLPGFALTTRRFSLARRVLARLGQLCCQGLIPNVIPDSGDDPVFRSIDCSLWWIEMLGAYLKASQDWEFLVEQYPIVKQIYKAFTAGTLHNIRIDASDGLITWDSTQVALTWMDAMVDEQPVTPRHGKPIEINALWYSALCWASQWADWLASHPSTATVDRLQNQARRYGQQAEQVKASLQRFWNLRQGYLFDRIEPDDRLDSSIRPNAVLALSLHHCAFSDEQSRQILRVARDRLLTPYGLRTLDPADFAYQGRYESNPRQRDLAAHQGTVWSWLLGPFLRSWHRFFASEGAPLPLELQPLLTHFEQYGCLGGISELFDGNFPHTPRGAVSHAVVIAELLQCWHENLNGDSEA